MASYSLYSSTLLPILLHLITSEVASTTFTITNNCGYPICPGILSNADVPSLDPTGFELQQGESRSIPAPAAWGGRMWGRTQCSEDSAGNFACATGDCGTGKVECSGRGAAPPASLIEFKLSGYEGKDYYDVSLIDGYNLAVLVAPRGGSGDNCSTTGCVADLNGACPDELAVSGDGGRVACRSACEAFRQPEYCCVGAYGTPDTCKSTAYSQVFKSACPRAYSYAYDDGTSTFTCSASPDYLITFCPSPDASQKSSDGPKSDTSMTIKSSMTYSDASGRRATWAVVRVVLYLLILMQIT